MTVPCYVTNDHRFRGTGACVECGFRLRCMCGQFVRDDKLDAHEAKCPWLVAHADEMFAEMLNWCICGDHMDEHCDNSRFATHGSVMGPCQTCGCLLFVANV